MSTIAPPPVIFTVPVLVDSQVNLENSGVLIPDGMLSKIVGDSRFKVGDGFHTWSELPWSPAVSGNNGLVYKDNELIVDFSQMPTDKFEALLKQLRLPIWLSEHTNVYINADTGSDVLSEGRGFSEDKPFKTVNAAYYYIVNNYNLNVYNVYFNLHGTFVESLIINGYNTSGGIIAFKSYGGDYSGKIIWNRGYENTFGVKSGDVYIYDLEIKLNITGINTTTPWYPATVAAWGNNATINLYGPHITINLTNKIENYIEPRILYATIGALITIYAHQTFNTWLIIEGGENITQGYGQYLRAESNGYIWLWSTEISQEAITIYCAGNNVAAAVAYEGTISVNPGFIYKPMFKTLPGKSCTGRRYWIFRNGSIWTNFLGEDYFPGTVAGFIENSQGAYC